MAFEKQHISNNMGIQLPNAYVKLDSVVWSSATGQTTAIYVVYANQTARSNNKVVVDTIEIDITKLYPSIAEDVYKASSIATVLTNATKI